VQNCDRVYEIVVICNGLDEFRDFAEHRRRKFGAKTGELYFLGTVARIYVGHYKKNKADRFESCYVFHYAMPGQSHKIRSIKVDSWEAWGTGDQRVDFEQVITMCKNRWNDMNPTTR